MLDKEVCSAVVDLKWLGLFMLAPAMSDVAS